MMRRAGFMRFSCLVVLSLSITGVSRADTLKQVTSASSQAGNDSLSWSQKGADGTILAASFNAITALSNAVTVGLAAPNSIVSTVCTASPCSWTGTGFAAGHSLLWTSDAGNGGSGPVTLTFGKNVAGAGALIQADIPGTFTAQIQVFNGATALASYAVTSDSAGDPVYLGAIDESGANISKVVFSLTACKSLCTDFGLDTIAVNGASATTTATLSPTSLTFGATTVGSTASYQAVSLKNSGTTTLNISSFAVTGTNASSFGIRNQTCGSTLSSGASCSFNVAFRPTTTGALSAAISVTDNATGSPQNVSLAGTGKSSSTPATSFSPTSLTFNPTTVGSTASYQAVSLKNTGTATLNISSFAVTGTNASSFGIRNQTCGSTLAAGASCSFNVAFRPTTTGTLSAAISVTDNATGSPQKVTLTGTGKSSSAPAVLLSPTSLTFKATTVGSTAGYQPVTLKNTGTATLNISSFAVNGTNPSSFGIRNQGCGSTLAAGASCSFDVAFRPTTTGTLSAAISITDNAGASPQTVALTGTGK